MHHSPAAGRDWRATASLADNAVWAAHCRARWEVVVLRSLLPVVAILCLLAAAGVHADIASPPGLQEDFGLSAAEPEAPWSVSLMPMFESAAAKYNVPLPLLLTLGYYGSGFENRGSAPTIEGGYGVMALRKNNQGGDSLALGARLTGYSEDTLKVEPAANIEAAAAVLDYYAGMWQIDRSRGLEAWLQPVIQYAGLDEEDSRFFAWEIFKALRDGFEQCVNAAGEPFSSGPHSIGATDLPSLLPAGVQTTNVDYPGAIWDAAASCNYSTAWHSSDTIIVHTMEGTLAGTRSWFKTCDRGEGVGPSSCQSNIGKDGTIVEMVRDYQTAWHVSCFNGCSIGIEHEGSAYDTTHPIAMYNASAGLARDLCNRWGIPKARFTPTTTCGGAGLCGHVDVTNCCCGTHTDPGSHWDWTYYINKINADPPREDLRIEPRGQHSAYYQEDGLGNWGNSGGWCASFDSGLSSGGSRYFPTTAISAAGRWMQVQPTLAVAGGTYTVYVAHYDNSLISTDIVVSTALTNCTASGGDLQSGSTTAFQFARGCQYCDLGNIVLGAGQTQPTIRFTYSSGTVSDVKRWNIEAFRFVHVPTPSTLSLHSSTGGSVSGGGSKTSGDSVTAVATPNTAYRFVSWTTGGFNGAVVSADASYTFTMPAQGYALYANFELNGTPLLIETCPPGAGTTTGEGGYNPGQQVTVTAAALPGYIWQNWTTGGCGGTVVSTSPSYTFSMPSTATTLYANFAVDTDTHVLSLTACDGCGTVSGAGSYATGVQVTATATPADDSWFVNWTTDGCGGTNVVSTGRTYTFAMPPNNYALYANFTKNPWVETFEIYAIGSLDRNDTSGPNQGSTNPWWGCAPPNGEVVNTHDGIPPHAGGKMLGGWHGNGVDYYNLAYRINDGSAFTGSFYVDWWFYDSKGTSGVYDCSASSLYLADSLSVCSYTGIPTNSDYPSGPPYPLPGAVQRLSLGMSTDDGSGFDKTKYQAHVTGAAGNYGSNGWYNLTLPRSVGWHHARVTVGPAKGSGHNDASFYIDDMAVPLLTADAVTTTGYNLIETPTMTRSTGASTCWPYYAYYDDISLGTPVSTAPNPMISLSGPSSIAWRWSTSATDMDGFFLSTASIGGASIKVPGAASRTYTEEGLAANTSYNRWVSAYSTQFAGDIESSRTALYATYTLAADPVFGSSGDGAVNCDKGPGSAAMWYPLGTSITFAPANGFGTGPARASRYQYVWSTSADEPNWATASQWTSGNLTRTPGSVGSYYLHLRACNGAGYANPNWLLLGPYTIKTATPVARIGDLWSADDAAPLSLSGKVVTACVGGAFWLEETDQSAALKVLWPAAIARGHAVNVYGSLQGLTTQRVMFATVVEDLGASPFTVLPVGMIQRSIGGGAINENTPGISGGNGLYNIGLLVRIAGTVTRSDSDDPDNKYFVIDDGSGLDDGNGHAGIKVLCGAGTPPSSGTVSVTGVIDAETDGGKVLPVIIVRDPSEIN